MTSRHFTPRNRYLPVLPTSCLSLWSYIYIQARARQHPPTSTSSYAHSTHIQYLLHTVVYQLSLCYCIFISWLPNLTDTYSTPFPHSSPPSFSELYYTILSCVSILDSLASTNIVRHYLILHNGRSLQLNFQLLGSAVSFCTDGPSTCSRSG